MIPREFAERGLAASPIKKRSSIVEHVENVKRQSVIMETESKKGTTNPEKSKPSDKALAKKRLDNYHSEDSMSTPHDSSDSDLALDHVPKISPMKDASLSSDTLEQSNNDLELKLRSAL